MFINIFIVQLKLLRVGCHVMMLRHCSLADDIILIRLSLSGLQQMLDTCCDVVSSISLSVNINKSHCIIIGKFHNCAIASMTLCGNYVDWCNSIKYLGVYI